MTLLDRIGLSDYYVVPPLNSATVAGQLILSLAPLGSHEPALVVKEKRSYISASEFRMHVALQRYVWERGGPVPESRDIVSLRDDGLERHFEIYAWASGDHGRRDETALSQIAKALARFHASSQSFVAGDFVHQEPRDRVNKARFYRKHLDDALPSRDRGIVDSLYHDLETNATALDHVTTVRTWLHGDADPVNAVIDQTGAVLLDLDDVHYGPAVADLAWFVTMTCALATAEPDDPSFRTSWDTSRAAAIVGAYADEARFSLRREELAHWLVASVVCASVDCFCGVEWRVDARRLVEELDRARCLIADAEDAAAGCS